MGYRSDVTILVQPKAYELIMKSIKDFNKTVDWSFTPNSTKKGNSSYIGDFYVLNWNCVKWYSEYKDVQSVEQVLDSLMTDHQEEEGYGFKQLIIGEDNATEERTNMMDLDSYLYAVCNAELDIGNTVLEEVEE